MNWRSILGHRSALRRAINEWQAAKALHPTERPSPFAETGTAYVLISPRLALAIEVELAHLERMEGILTDPKYHLRVQRKVGLRTLKEDLSESLHKPGTVVYPHD